MIATEKDTKGLRISPSSSSGLIQPVTGPATIPKINKTSIAGNLVLYANHCAEIPSATTALSPTKMCSSINYVLILKAL